VRSDRRAIGSLTFFLLYLSYTRNTLSGVITVLPEAHGCYMGLILKRCDSSEGVESGLYKRLGFFVSLVDGDKGEVSAPFARHKPALEPSHYIEYDEESGQSTIIVE